MKKYDFQTEFIEAVDKEDIPYLRSFIASTIRVDLPLIRQNAKIVWNISKNILSALRNHLRKI